MTEKEIIEGLMIYLHDHTINVTKLVRKVGVKDCKKFEKALAEAFKIIES